MTTMIRLRLRFKRARTLIYKICLWSLSAVAVLALSSENPTPQQQFIFAAVGLSILAPVIALGFLQLCFCVYHSLVHGNAFYDPGIHQRVVYVERPTPKKDTRKLCPVCKRRTNCKVGYSKGLKVTYHIIKN